MGAHLAVLSLHRGWEVTGHRAWALGQAAWGSAVVLFLLIYVILSWLLSLSEHHENEVTMPN